MILTTPSGISMSTLHRKNLLVYCDTLYTVHVHVHVHNVYTYTMYMYTHTNVHLMHLHCTCMIVHVHLQCTCTCVHIDMYAEYTCIYMYMYMYIAECIIYMYIHMYMYVESIRLFPFQPSWTMYIQVMTYEQAKTHKFNPFDVTKVTTNKCVYTSVNKYAL